MDVAIAHSVRNWTRQGHVPAKAGQAHRAESSLALWFGLLSVNGCRNCTLRAQCAQLNASRPCACQSWTGTSRTSAHTNRISVSSSWKTGQRCQRRAREISDRTQASNVCYPGCGTVKQSCHMEHFTHHGQHEPRTLHKQWQRSPETSHTRTMRHWGQCQSRVHPSQSLPQTLQALP